jgi:hypothetical protein
LSTGQRLIFVRDRTRPAKRRPFSQASGRRNGSQRSLPAYRMPLGWDLSGVDRGLLVCLGGVE